MNVNTHPVTPQHRIRQQDSNGATDPGHVANSLPEPGPALPNSGNAPIPRSARANAEMATRIRSQFLERAALCLNTAIGKGDSAELERILNLHGINPNTPSNGITPLTMAVMMNDLHAITTLLARPGLNVNAADMQGDTALHLATQAGQVEQMNALLGTAGIDAHLKNRRGLTPLCIAAQLNRDDAVQLLLLYQMPIGTAPGSSPEEYFTAYMQAMERNAFKATIAMLRDIPDFVDVRRPDGHTVLTAAIRQGRHDVVRTLLKQHPHLDLNRAGEGLSTALNAACRQGSVDQVLTLLRHPGLDPNASLDEHGTTALHQAAAHRNVSIVQVLLGAGPAIDVNAEAKFIGTPLHTAVMFGDMEVIRMLAARVDDINQATEDGWTALHFAAFAGQTEAVQFLLQEPNIDVDVPSKVGVYPSHVAKDFGHTELAQRLSRAEMDAYFRKPADVGWDAGWDA